MEKRIGPKDLVLMKQKKEKITVITAYDFIHAQIADEVGIPVILVGDSLAHAVGGQATTLSVSMEQMIYHGRIVSTAVKKSLVVIDMPYMSYHVSLEKSIENAGRLVKEAGAHAVKLEGGQSVLADIIPALIRAQIPVMGHLGLTPQSFNIFGGYKIQGKDEDSKQRIIEDALFLEKAGCFALVLEGIPANLAEQITEQLTIPTIGIGAGVHTDGQVLVVNDMLGYNQTVPKFVRKFENFHERTQKAMFAFKEAVLTENFPNENESYHG